MTEHCTVRELGVIEMSSNDTQSEREREVEESKAACLTSQVRESTSRVRVNCQRLCWHSCPTTRVAQIISKGANH